MPILLVLLLAVLIAQFGFWDTFQGVLGAFAMLAMFMVFLVAFLALGGWYAWNRVTRSRTDRLPPGGSGPLPRVGGEVLPPDDRRPLH